MCSAVSDADGDTVRCRWANSSLGECAGVCQTFPATLHQVGYMAVVCPCYIGECRALWGELVWRSDHIP